VHLNWLQSVHSQSYLGLERENVGGSEVDPSQTVFQFHLKYVAI
jgi:hypothetical protein